MNRLLWFVLGGMVTAAGFGIASVMLDGESGRDSLEGVEDEQEATAPQEDIASEESVS